MVKNMMYWTNFAFWNISNNISDIFHHSNITGFMAEKFKSLTFIKFLSTAASFVTTWTIKLPEKYILNLPWRYSAQFSSGVEMLKITTISCNYSTKIKRKFIFLEIILFTKIVHVIHYPLKRFIYSIKSKSVLK